MAKNDGDIYALLKKQEEDKKKSLYLPKTLDLANSLFLAFIKKNNLVGLKLCILFSGARGQIVYDKDNRVKFNVSRLCELLNISNRQLSANMKKVLNVHFTYKTDEGDIGMTTPIHSYEYKNRSKEIYIEVSSKAKKLFTELSKDCYSFNQASAYNLMRLKNKHSIRMQLLLEQINNFDEDMGKRKRYTLGQLNGYFGVNHRNYYDLERSIIKPIQEEINSSSRLGFIYELIDEAPSGVGRPKIKEVVIDIIDNSKNIIDEEINDYLSTLSKFKKYIQKRYRANVEEKIFPTIIRIKEGNVKINFKGKLYLVKNDGATEDYEKEKSVKMWKWLYDLAKQGKLI